MLTEGGQCLCPNCPWKAIAAETERRCAKLAASNSVMQETHQYLVDKCRAMAENNAQRVAELEAALACRTDASLELQVLRDGFSQVERINERNAQLADEVAALRGELNRAQLRESTLLDQIETLQTMLEKMSELEERRRAHDRGPSYSNNTEVVAPMVEAIRRLEQTATTRRADPVGGRPPDAQQSQMDIHFKDLQEQIRRLEDNSAREIAALTAVAARATDALQVRERLDLESAERWRAQTREVVRTAVEARAELTRPVVQTAVATGPAPLAETTTFFVPFSNADAAGRVEPSSRVASIAAKASVQLPQRIASRDVAPQPSSTSSNPTEGAGDQHSNLKPLLPVNFEPEITFTRNPNNPPTPERRPPVATPSGDPDSPKSQHTNTHHSDPFPQGINDAPVSVGREQEPTDAAPEQGAPPQAPVAPQPKKLALKFPPTPTSEIGSVAPPPAAPKKLALKLPVPGAPLSAPVKKLALKIPPKVAPPPAPVA